MCEKIDVRFVFIGHSVGRLRANGAQVFHGRGTDQFGCLESVQHRHWLVQTFHQFLSGRAFKKQQLFPCAWIRSFSLLGLLKLAVAKGINANDLT